jgi:two-component system probable response regulator PhcQ
VNWASTDHADLVEAEAARGIALGQRLRDWQPEFSAAAAPDQALAALAQALGGQAQFEGASVRVEDRHALTDLLAGPPSELPSAAQSAWLAWLVPRADAVEVKGVGSGWAVALQTGSSPLILPQDWLATEVEGLLEGAARSD